MEFFFLFLMDSRFVLSDPCSLIIHKTKELPDWTYKPNHSFKISPNDYKPTQAVAKSHLPAYWKAMALRLEKVREALEPKGHGLIS